MSTAPGVSVDRLGTASPATSLTTATIYDGIQYVVTRSLEPTIVAGYDFTRNDVVTHCEIPGVDGSWASLALDDAIYIGTYHPAELHRYTPGAGTVERIASLSDDEFVWDVDTDGERIFVSTWPTGRILEVSPDSDTVRSLGQAVEGEEYARSVSVTEETIYVGVGSHAHFVALDRDTGERRQLLPDRFAHESFVYDVVATDDTVVCGTAPEGHLCAFDRESERLIATAAPIDAGGIMKLFAGPDDWIYLTAKRELDDESITALQRFSPRDGTVEAIATVPGSGVAIGADRRRIRGASSNGLVWSWPFAGGALETVDLASVGMPRGGERPQSIVTIDGNPIVGGHGQFTRHHLDDRSTESVPLSGEPKAMAVVDGTVYAGVYTGAHLVAYDPAAGSVRIVATVGESQNRPRALVHYRPTDQLLMGTVPEYGHLGGAIAQYDLTVETLSVTRGVVPDQSIHSIAVAGESVYLGSDIHGGLGVDPVATAAEIVAWDPVAESTRWSMPIDDVSALVDLIVHEDRLLATATRQSRTDRASADREDGPDAEVIVVDPAERAILHREPIGRRPGDLLYHEGQLLAITDDLLGVDPDGSTETLVEDLDGDWYNWPMLAADTGSIYTVTGYDLARITFSEPPS